MKKIPVRDEDLLLSYGATEHEFKAFDTIFNVGDQPRFYYQIITGKVKLNHEDDDGRELIQSILEAGDSLCELLLFIDRLYPVNAVSLGSCKILRLPKLNFLDLLENNPGIAVEINKFISERLYQKFVLMQFSSSLQPQTRLKGVLNFFKSFNEDQSKYSFEIALTRKQLASLTALRTETVIRTIKKLEVEGFVKITNGKVFI